jgi:hypothetical protein
MLETREQISKDANFGALTEAILERDQPRTSDVFHRMVTEQGRSVGDALSIVAAAEAPFVQVHSHINVREGNITLINNDHTLLGLRSSVSLMSFMPKGYSLLPLLQSVWYVPAGLDIWNQLLGRYPGRYASMKGMNVPPPDYGPVVWNADAEPIVTRGTLEERLHEQLVATISGDAKRAYGLFLGLAEEERARPALRDQIRFLGAIDMQETVIGRKARNTGHKSIRARAITDLIDFIGWEKAHGVFYMGVPDMAVGPLYYSLYDAVCVMVAEVFPEDGGKGLKQANRGRLDEAEVEDLIDLLMSADQPTVFAKITEHLRAGISLNSLGDTIQVAAAELILRITVPRSFTEGQHAFDYCNTVNDWIRTTDNPYQPRMLYLMVNFVNDVARSLKLQTSILAEERRGLGVSARTGAALLKELDETILALDFPRATMLADAYLSSGADRQSYLSAVAVTACKFQDDPHNQKITHSSYEEYGHNSTHLKDRLLLAAVRLLAGWPKMPGERDCFARFEADWSRR